MTSTLSVFTLTRPANRLTPDSTDWRDQAACREVDPETFFIADLEPAARAICAGCPVAALCLEDALDFEGGVEVRHGVRGGLTAQERVNLHRKTRRKERAEAATRPPQAHVQARVTKPAKRPVGPQRPPDCADPSLTASTRHTRAREPYCSACRAIRSAAERERRAAKRAGGGS